MYCLSRFEKRNPRENHSLKYPMCIKLARSPDTGSQQHRSETTMLAILSPAKTLDFDTPSTCQKFSTPDFLDDATKLITRLRKYSPHEISDLMKISSKLGEQNFSRYADWHTPFDQGNAKQALLAFKGDVYLGLEAWSFDRRDFNWAQKRLRILSGLYGVLRPLDLIQPYRLEMGTRLPTSRAKDLYGFWGTRLRNALDQALDEQGDRILVNLASREYSDALQLDGLDCRIITPTFKDLKAGKYRFMSFYGKKARGAMARYLVKNRVKSVRSLKAFDKLGYRFSEELSRGDDWVFLRDKPE